MKHAFWLLLCALAACGGPPPIMLGPANAATGAADPNNLCGTGNKVIGYASYAAAVLNNNCVSGCHISGGAQGQLPMDTFANAQASLTATNVSVVGTGVMPPTGALNAAGKCIVLEWVTQGYPP